MNRPNPGKLAAFVLGLIVLAALPVFLKGGLYITNFEGDAFHLADIALRMANGERPHIDFMTPLGALGFVPVTWFLRVGFDLGQAFALGQTAFALLVAAPLIWAAWTRLQPALAYAFSAAVVALLMSLTHGSEGAIVAVSMHYNRWAWAVSFVAILLVILPPRGRSMPWIDGTLIALAMATLAFLKVTYFVAFVPILALILLIRRDWRQLGAGLAAGIVLAAVIAGLVGIPALQAYQADLMATAGAEVRAYPGLALHALVISPPYFVGIAASLVGMMALRRAGQRSEGLAVLLLIPGCVYVTWQNFGNDPVWLIVIATIFAALRPRRDPKLPAASDPSVGVLAAALAAFVLAVPLLHNHSVSGVRLLTLNTARYLPLVPERKGLADVYMPVLPARLVRARENLTDPGQAYAALAPDVPDHAPIHFQGETLGTCQIVTGLQAALSEIGAALAEQDSPVFVADLISSHWLYSDGAPLSGGAPWNYGTLAGLDKANYVLVPVCAIDANARNLILRKLDAADHALKVVRRTPQFLLYN